MLKDVALHRQPLTAVPGVQFAQDAVGIALLPKPRQADEAISDFEIQVVQQSTVDLLAIVSSCALAACLNSGMKRHKSCFIRCCLAYQHC